MAWVLSAGMVDGLLFEVNNTADVVTIRYIYGGSRHRLPLLDGPGRDAEVR
jgi:hypothetical protein